MQRLLRIVAIAAPLFVLGVLVYHVMAYGLPELPAEWNHGTWRVTWFRYHYEYPLLVALIGIVLPLSCRERGGWRISMMACSAASAIGLILCLLAYPGID